MKRKREANPEAERSITRNANTTTPLMEACANGRTGDALALIRSGDDFKPGSVNNEGKTALMLAIENSNIENNMQMVALALIHNERSRPGHVNNEGKTALMLAIEANMEVVAEALVETGHSNPSHINLTGKTALALAIEHNMKDVALALITAGALDPDALSTVFFVSEQMEDDDNNAMEEIALALIAAGASDPDALLLALENQMENVALALIAAGKSNPGKVNENGNTALMIACMIDMPEVAMALIATGESNPGQVNEDGNTALILACKYDEPEVAMALIATGESIPGHLNENGNTALILACKYDMPKVAMALIATGESNPGRVSEDGDTALIVACDNSMPEVAMALIATGASNPGRVSSAGSTALILAMRSTKFQSDIIKALIETGESNPGHVYEGFTALIYALLFKPHEIAKALIETGESNPGHVYNGNTALILTCARKLDDMALTLIATGKSNPGYVDTDGKTALDYAKANDMTEVIRAITDSDQTYLKINVNRICYDVQNDRNLYVHEFLQEDKKNVVFMIVSKKSDGELADSATVVGITVDNLKLTPDNEYKRLIYGCKQLGTMKPENLITDRPYYDFKVAVGFGDLVVLSQLESVVEDVEKNEFNSRLFSAIETEPRLLSTASRHYLSTRQCQGGREGTVYEIMSCAPENGPREEMPASDAPPAAPEGHIILKINEELVSIPITGTTTMGDVRKQIATQKGVKVDAVRFFYNGRLILDAQLATEVKTGDVVITMIRQPPPPEGGGRGKHTKKKRGGRKRKGGKRTATAATSRRVYTKKNCTRRK